jgi:hypothetical protein
MSQILRWTRKDHDTRLQIIDPPVPPEPVIVDPQPDPQPEPYTPPEPQPDPIPQPEPTAPVITALTPRKRLPSGIPVKFMLKVVGTGFTEESVILWGLDRMETTFASPTEVKALIALPSLLPGIVQITVDNGGRVSEGLPFTISVTPGEDPKV